MMNLVLLRTHGAEIGPHRRDPVLIVLNILFQQLKFMEMVLTVR
jgi:energy-converting hydrogenase Eha subunit E